MTILHRSRRSPEERGADVEKIDGLARAHDHEIGAHWLAAIEPRRLAAKIFERHDDGPVKALIDPAGEAELLLRSDDVSRVGRVRVGALETGDADAAREFRLAEGERDGAVVAVLHA